MLLSDELEEEEDADEVELDAEELEPESAELIAEIVLEPATPSADNPFARWKAETAASVLLP